MTQDARFADADPRPLALMGQSAEDVQIISALLQDAVLSGADMSYDPRGRRLSLLVNRFRWEDAEQARAEGRDYERVRAVLQIGDVHRLTSDGITRDTDTVLELLAINWTAGSDGTGNLSLEFAGDGAIRAEVECINLDLRDVSRPYRAVSGKAPTHPA